MTMCSNIYPGDLLVWTSDVRVSNHCGILCYDARGYGRGDLFLCVGKATQEPYYNPFLFMLCPDGTITRCYMQFAIDHFRAPT